MLEEEIRRAQRAHREVVEAVYDGICRIYEKRPVKDLETMVTRREEVLTHEDVSCHISFSGAAPAAGSETVTSVTQTIKLFLGPEIEVRPGSRIEVRQQGRTESYARSGVPAVYSSHQEVLLERWKEHA